MKQTNLPGSRYVRLGDLQIDKDYQRDRHQPFINKIAREFDPQQFGVIEVAQRPSGLFVVDGQARVCAMRLKGFADNTLVPGIVRPHATVQDEARRFVKFNLDRRRPTAYDLYKAELVAVDPPVRRIDSVLHLLQLHAVSHNSTDSRGIRAVGTLREIEKWHGAELLERVLRISLSAWSEDILHGCSAGVLDALTAFLVTHASHGHAVEDAALIKVCSRMSAQQFCDRKATTGIPSYKAMAADLQEPYNRAAHRQFKIDLLTPSMYTKRPRRPAGAASAEAVA